MQKIKNSIPIKILASITLLFLLFCVFLNLFGFNKPKMVVSANTVIQDYTFEGSDLFLPFSLYYLNDSYGHRAGELVRSEDGSVKQVYLKISFSFFKVDSSTLQVKVKSEGTLYLESSTPTIGVNSFTSYPCVCNETFNISSASDVFLPLKYYDPITSLWEEYTIRFYIFSNDGNDSGFSSFNSNVYKLMISSDFNDPNDSNGLIVGGNQLKYYDENNNYICFSAFSTFDASGKFENYIGYYFFGLDTRTYYFSSSFSDNNMYNSGLTDGYNNGFSAGASSGYTDGFSAGKVEGYNNGYTAGVDAANTYSFNSLLGAVIDVPVQTFTSLFNFELLGVNLAAFFSGLLTLAVIITIVKLLI